MSKRDAGFDMDPALYFLNGLTRGNPLAKTKEKCKKIKDQSEKSVDEFSILRCFCYEGEFIGFREPYKSFLD
jgi:hypothetical protein